MAVTLFKKGRADVKRRTDRPMNRKNPVKRRSAAGAALADPRYRKRVVKSAKAYRRKGKARLAEDEDI